MEKAFVATLIALSLVALGVSSVVVLGNLGDGILGSGHMGMMYDDGPYESNYECAEYAEAQEYCDEHYEENGLDHTPIEDHEHYEECEEHMHHEEYGSRYYPCH